MLRPNLPEILGARELLEVLRRDTLHLLHEPQRPEDLLDLLGGEGVEELLNG